MKQIYLQHKQEALIENIQVHEKELVQEGRLFKNPAVSFIEKQDEYKQKEFKSTERLVQTIYAQRGIRSISSSHNIIHFLHTQRNK